MYKKGHWYYSTIHSQYIYVIDDKGDKVDIIASKIGVIGRTKVLYSGLTSALYFEDEPPKEIIKQFEDNYNWLLLKNGEINVLKDREMDEEVIRDTQRYL